MVFGDPIYVVGNVLLLDFTIDFREIVVGVGAHQHHPGVGVPHDMMRNS